MKIAINTLSENPLNPSGSLDFFKELATFLPKIDPINDYFFFVSNANKHLFERDYKNYNLIIAGQSNERRLLRLISEQTSLPYRIYKSKADVFFSSSSGGGAPLIIPKNTKLIVGVYGTHHLCSIDIGTMRKFYRYLIMKYSLNRANVIVVNSESCKSDLLNYNSSVKSKIRVVNHGISKKLFHDGRITDVEKQILQESKVKIPYILFVSVIWYYKNIHTLAEAFGKFIQKTKSHHSLVLIGQFDKTSGISDDYKERLISIAKNYGVADRINFLGYIPKIKLRPFYRAADVYVQPSLHETFGKTLIEAMACGCPVIAANNSSMPELLGNAGLLFETENSDNLSLKLEKMLTDSELRLEFIRRGKARAKKFTIEKEISQLVDVFHLAARS